jgi:hypothetical protein
MGGENSSGGSVGGYACIPICTPLLDRGKPITGILSASYQWSAILMATLLVQALAKRYGVIPVFGQKADCDVSCRSISLSLLVCSVNVACAVWFLTVCLVRGTKIAYLIPLLGSILDKIKRRKLVAADSDQMEDLKD